MTDRADPSAAGPAWQLAFSGARLLVVDDDAGPHVPTAEDLQGVLEGEPEAGGPEDLELPDADGRPCRAWTLPEGMREPPGFGLRSLRSLHAALSPELFRVAGTAYQKLHWLRTHGYCSRCGHRTERHGRHQAMVCTACGQLHFPRLSPAIIVLVERDHRMLLARSPHFPEGMYSTLAGFVEPGESLEDTLHREIREEVGVEVSDLRYFGSQPWPFPHSLMVGFHATWAGGVLRPDGEEIVDARWFGPDDLPPRLPGPVSIARRLIRDFLERQGAPTPPRPSER